MQEHPFAHLHQTLGNHAVARLLQTKLKVGQPNDQYEQEADRVAEQVTNMPEPVGGNGNAASNASGVVQRDLAEGHSLWRANMKEEEEQVSRQPLKEEEDKKIQRKEEEEEPVQTKAAAQQTPNLSPKAESNIHAMKGKGKALPESARGELEPRFGYDFSRVRIHTDTPAAETAHALKARAFTVGHDIAFNSGEYAPETAAGKKLLAHELTHVVQQMGGLRRREITLQRQAASRFIESGVAEGAGVGEEERLVRKWVSQGARNENMLTNKLFYRRHPETNKSEPLRKGSPAANEWMEIRNQIVRLALKTKSQAAGEARPGLQTELLKPLKQRLMQLLGAHGPELKAPSDATVESQAVAAKTRMESEITATLREAMALEDELRKKHPNYGKEAGFEGYGEGKDQYVCTTFAQEVLRRAGYEISGDIGKQLNISIDWEKELGKKKPSKDEKKRALADLVKQGDPRTKGVVLALVSSGQGVEIQVDDLQPGDFVQYWYASGGHVIQVKEVQRQKGSLIVQAHGSHGSKHGVATITLTLKKKGKLSSWLKKVYCVRPNPNYPFAK